MWPGAWSTTRSRPASWSVMPSVSSSTSSGSLKVSPPKSCWPGHSGRPLAGVGQQRAVIGVNVGRDAPGPADRRHRPDVVDVPMRRQHRDRPQPVLLDDFLDALLSVLTRVDNQALRAWLGRQQVAVRRERASGEPGYQHRVPLALFQPALFPRAPLCPAPLRPAPLHPARGPSSSLTAGLVKAIEIRWPGRRCPAASARQDTGWARLGLEK